MKNYRAIIIDDEKNVREALGIMLRDHCPEIKLCGSASSAADGRQLLDEEVVDFIFLDISMLKEDGFAELSDGTMLNISRRKLIEFRDAVKHFSKSVE